MDLTINFKNKLNAMHDWYCNMWKILTRRWNINTKRRNELVLSVTQAMYV